MIGVEPLSLVVGAIVFAAGLSLGIGVRRLFPVETIRRAPVTESKEHVCPSASAEAPVSVKRTVGELLTPLNSMTRERNRKSKLQRELEDDMNA